jgi:hypothetical protein
MPHHNQAPLDDSQGLSEVESTTEDRMDRQHRVRKRPLLTEAVRFHIPK